MTNEGPGSVGSVGGYSQPEERVLRPMKRVCARLVEKVTQTTLVVKYLRFWITYHKATTHIRKYSLLRFLIDSRQVSTGGATKICWVPSCSRRSFLFVLYPSPSRAVDTSGWLWSGIREFASYLLLTGRDVYELPEGTSKGVILYEIPFDNIVGMDYSNNLTADGRWAIETKEVLKWHFQCDTDLFDFVSGSTSQYVLVVLAAVCAVSPPSHRYLRLLPQESPWVAACLSAPSPVSTETPVAAVTIRTNMVVLYFDDESAPLLPGSLWNILKDKKHEVQLKQVESGLPSWAMFLPQKNIYYRTWLRTIVQTIAIVWPIITLIAALIDLYRSFETIRTLTANIAAIFDALYDQICVVVVLIRGFLWSLVQPIVNSVWVMLSDWSRGTVLSVCAHINFVFGWFWEYLYWFWDILTAIPVFSALAETKAYFVSMLLPYFADLFTAISSALRLWLQVISNAWKVLSGSMVAVLRVVGSVARVPKWFANTIKSIFDAFKAAWLMLRHVVTAVNWSTAGKGVSQTADHAVRWTMINSARQAITGVVSRTWNLTIFIGTEISKHWVTWVHRPFTTVLEWFYTNWDIPVAASVALPLFGVVSHLFYIPSENHEIIDIFVYSLCCVVVRLAWPLLNGLKSVVVDMQFLKGSLSVFIAVIAWHEARAIPKERQSNEGLLILALIFTGGLLWSSIVRAVEWIHSEHAKRTSRASTPPSLSSHASTPPPLCIQQDEGVMSIPRARTAEHYSSVTLRRQHSGRKRSRDDLESMDYQPSFDGTLSWSAPEPPLSVPYVYLSEVRNCSFPSWEST
eukprot:TRINITY_DN31503_c0_g1_i1.p1 TRINITY_DN31503_c0_g1~~TRINITY_DN31503_c0_g1_i1.p1  ORF type:complete len:800 (+),score=86.07 TRINITY_DN31503_c0_g1_i1:69-2468(+)